MATAPTFLRSVMTVAGGTAVAQAVALAALPFITRLYPPELYGAFVVFLAWGGFVLPLVCARLDVAIPLPRRARSAGALAAGALAVTAGLVALTALAVAAALALRPAWAVYGLAWLPLHVALGGAVQVAGQWASRTRAFAALSWSRILQALVTALLSVALAWAWSSAPVALVLATLAGQAAALVLLGWQLRGDLALWRVSARQAWRLMRHFRRLASFNVPHVMSDAVQASGLPLLLAAGFGAPAAAYYAFASRLLKAPLGLVSGAITQVYYPRAASHRSDDVRLRADALRLLRASAPAALLALPVLLLLPDALFAWAFGERWAALGGYLRAMSPWILSAFVAAPLSALYLVKERFALDFALSLGATALAFALLWVGLALGLGVTATLWLMSLGMTAYIVGSTVFEFRVVIGGGGRGR
jgi:O-antigen/teichoic acid export membrane protein